MGKNPVWDDGVESEKKSSRSGENFSVPCPVPVTTFIIRVTSDSSWLEG